MRTSTYGVCLQREAEGVRALTKLCGISPLSSLPKDHSIKQSRLQTLHCVRFISKGAFCSNVGGTTGHKMIRPASSGLRDLIFIILEYTKTEG